MSLGSSLFTKPTANKPHLTKNSPNGVGGEVAKARQDVINQLAPQLALAVEEWDYPPAAAVDLIKTSIITSVTAAVYTGAALNGTVGAAAFVAPRRLSVTQVDAADDYQGSVTFKGLDARGKVISEAVALTINPGGLTTTATTKYFAKVTEIDVPAQKNALGHFKFGISGNLIGLARAPKARTGSVLIEFEYMDGAIISPITGTLTDAATAPPYGAYTAAAAPTNQGAASIEGSADITAGALYGGGGTLNGLTIILNINGVGATTLTLNGATNAATEAALLAAIVVKWPTLTAVQGGAGGNKLVLTTLLTGPQASIVVGAGTANAALGITGLSSTGGGHLYAIYYEYDPTAA